MIRPIAISMLVAAGWQCPSFTTSVGTYDAGACPTGYDTSADGTACLDHDACDGTQVCTGDCSNPGTLGCGPFTKDYPCQDLPAPSLNYTCRGQFPDWAPSDSPATFTVNADATVTDSRSGLVWQQPVGPTTYNWGAAKAFCDGLVYANFEDWRLPSKAELESIVDYGRHDPAIDPTAFPNTPAEIFWSSSPSPVPLSAWGVDFSSGISFGGSGSSSASFRARCVRSSASVVASSGTGGPPPGRYTVNAGTVTDALTGLVWQQAVDYCSYTQANAIAHCASLTLGGSSWRLPRVSELLTLFDPTQMVNPSASTPFPRPSDSTACPIMGGAFWSSSVYVGAAGSAWSVDSYSGQTYFGDTGGANLVRCVGAAGGDAGTDGGTPTPGGSCATTTVLCYDTARALECAHGIWVALPCRGPGGCLKAGNIVTCDTSLNQEGDRCAATAIGTGICSPDRTATLECRNDTNGNTFVKTNTCRICTVVRNTVTGKDEVVCEP